MAWLDRAGWSAAFVLLAATGWQLPESPRMDLDASWQMSLWGFTAAGLEFGREVIFTFGPLGFLRGTVYSGEGFWLPATASLVLSVMVATIMLRDLRHETAFVRIAVVSLLAAVAVVDVGLWQWLVMALVGVTLIHGAERLGPIDHGVRIVLVAILSLVKFTQLALGLTIVALVAATLVARRRGLAVTLVGLYSSSALVLWLAAGQELSSILPYLRRSLEVSSGYVDAMIVSPSPASFCLAAATIVVGAIYASLAWRARPEGAALVPAFAFLGFFVFASWKSGFVRADVAHRPRFFLSCLVVVLCMPRPSAGYRGTGAFRATSWLFVAVVLAGALETGNWGPGRTTRAIFDQLELAARAIVRSDELEAERRRELEVVREANALPRSISAIGNQTVDVLGFEQSIAWVHALSYTPRPVFQSYVAYTAELARINRDWYRSERAPEYVLAKLGSIDAHAAGNDDSLVWSELPYNYTFVHAEREYTLWRRRGTVRRVDAELEPLLVTELAPGVPLDLSAWSGRPLWMTIDLPLNALGRLVRLLMRPPLVGIAVSTPKNGVAQYTLPLTGGQTGFVASPVLTDEVAWLYFAAGLVEQPSSRIEIVISRLGRALFHDTARVEVFALPAPPIENRGLGAVAEGRRFANYSTAPIAFESVFRPSPVLLGARPAYFLHAPSRLVFRVPENARIARGSFGFIETSYERHRDSDGAEFRIVYRSEGREVVLLRRFLDPVRVVTDRGAQTYRLELPTRNRGALLELVVSSGPFANNVEDWTALGAVEFELGPAAVDTAQSH